LVKECPNCHSIEDDSSVFCSKCGYRFESRISVSEVPVKPEEVVWMGKPHPLFFLESPMFGIGFILMVFALGISFIFSGSFAPFVILTSVFSFLIAVFAFRAYQKGDKVIFFILVIIYLFFIAISSVFSLISLSLVIMYLGYVDGVLSVEYLISRDKIFITKKFLYLTKREVLLKEVRDIIIQVSFLGRLFGYGDVIPLTGGMIDLWAVSRHIIKYSVIRGVPSPEHVEKIIRSLITSKSK